MVVPHTQPRATGDDSLRPYYLLWGFRKCGTTSLARRLQLSGVEMPGWDENNIWMGKPDEITGHLRQVWGGRLDEAAYLVDLSTLTHLSPVSPGELLRPLGFRPEYIVCTRSPGPRWISARAHMVRKRTDRRSLRDYIDFYGAFIGLSWSDLRQLETDLIERDLRRGVKSRRGVFDAGYFRNAFPHGFEASPTDPIYQYRYFGETIDMLEKRPERFVELALETPEQTVLWISDSFAISPDHIQGGGTMNRSSAFNTLRHHPIVAGLSRHVPRKLRRAIAHSVETFPLLSGQASKPDNADLEKEMATLVVEMLDGHRHA